MTPPAKAWTLRSAVAPGLAAVRRNLAPFLLIQLGAFAFVVFYYRSAALQAGADVVMAWKLAGGIPFAFAAGALAGGVIPEVSKALTGRLRKLDRKWALDSLYNGFVYGIVGVQVDLFYRFQTWAFGDGKDVGTLLLKTAVDMLLFATLISIPTALCLYEWRRLGFKLRALVRQFSWAFYRDKVVPGIIPCWAFWIPILLCVYSMPADLQFCFSILAEAAWSILFVFIATEGLDHSSQASAKP